MKPTYKKRITSVPFCPKCKAKLSKETECGDWHYTCKCGQWIYDGDTGNYEIVVN